MQPTTESEEIVLGTQTPWEPAPCSLFHVPSDVRVPLAIDDAAYHSPCTPTGACRAVGSAALLASDHLPHRLAPSLDRMTTKAGEGRCVNVVIHKTSPETLEVWVDGRKQEFETKDTPEPQTIKLPPVRIHGKVASPVSVAFFCEEGCTPPESVTLRYNQVLKMHDQVTQSDVGLTARVEPITTRQLAGRSVVVPYPLSYVQSPYIQIRDVMPLRKARARRLRALVTTVFFVALGFFLESIILFVAPAFTFLSSTLLGKFFSFFSTAAISGYDMNTLATAAGSAFPKAVGFVMDLVSGFGLGTLLENVFTELIKVTDQMDALPYLGADGTPVFFTGYDKFVLIMTRMAQEALAGEFVRAGQFASAAVAPVGKALSTFLQGVDPPPIHFVSYTLKDLSDSLRVLGSAHKKDISRLAKKERVLAEYLSEKSETQYYKAMNFLKVFVGIAFSLVNLFVSAVNSIMSIPPFPRVGGAYMRGLDVLHLSEQACVTHTIEVVVEDTQLCGTVPRLLLVAEDNEALVGGLIESNILDDMETLKAQIQTFQEVNSASGGEQFANFVYAYTLGLASDFRRLLAASLRGKNDLYMKRSRRSFQMGASRLYGNLFGIDDDATGGVFDKTVGLATRTVGDVVFRAANAIVADEQFRTAEPIADSTEVERRKQAYGQRLKAAVADALQASAAAVPGPAAGEAARAAAVAAGGVALLPAEVLAQFELMVKSIASLNLSDLRVVQAARIYRDQVNIWFAALDAFHAKYRKLKEYLDLAASMRAAAADAEAAAGAAAAAAAAGGAAAGEGLATAGLTVEQLTVLVRNAREAFVAQGGSLADVAKALHGSADAVGTYLDTIGDVDRLAAGEAFVQAMQAYDAAFKAAKTAVDTATVVPPDAASAAAGAAEAVAGAGGAGRALFSPVLGAVGGYVAAQAAQAAALASVSMVGRLGRALSDLTAYECNRLGVCLDPLRNSLLRTNEWVGAEVSGSVPPQDCRIVPTFLELRMNAPSVLNTRDGGLSYLSAESNAAAPTGADAMSPAEVSSLLSKAMQNVRGARQAFRDSRDDILGWQQTSSRVAIVQFRKRPLDHVRSLRRVGTYAPFALNVPRDVAARVDQNPFWNNRHVEEMVTRKDSDSLWSVLGLPDTPVSWAAAHVFSDLVTDVNLAKYPTSLRLMYSGTDIVRMRFKEARALLLEMARLDTSFHMDDAVFQCLPGGVDAHRMLSRLGILRARSFSSNTGTGVRVLSYDCRELVTDADYMSKSPAFRKAVDAPPVLASRLVDCIDAFGKLSASKVALNNGIPSLAALGCSGLDAPGTRAAREFVEDAHRRHDSVDALIRRLFDPQGPQGQRLQQLVRDSQPFFDPSNPPLYDVHVAHTAVPPYDLDRLLTSLQQRNARMTIMTTDSVYTASIADAAVHSDGSLGDESVRSLTALMSRQTLTGGRLEALAIPTMRRRLVVPIGAGDFWYHFPYAYPRSGAFLLDLVPIDLETFSKSLSIVLANLGDPDPSVMPVAVPEIHELVRGNAETIDLDAKSMDGRTLIPTASIALSDNPESEGTSKIIFNAERIAQAVLALMGEMRPPPPVVRVVQPAGYNQSQAERRRRLAEIRRLQGAVEGRVAAGAVLMNSYLEAANTRVVQIRDGSQRAVDEARDAAANTRVARLKQFVRSTAEYVRNFFAAVHDKVLRPDTRSQEQIDADNELKREFNFDPVLFGASLALAIADDELPHEEPGAIDLHDHCETDAIAPQLLREVDPDSVAAGDSGPSGSPSLTGETVAFSRAAVVMFFEPKGRDKLRDRMILDATTPTDGAPSELAPGEWTWDRPRGDPDEALAAQGEKTFLIEDASEVEKNTRYAQGNATRMVNEKLDQLDRDLVSRYQQELKDAQDKLLGKIEEFVRFNEHALAKRDAYNRLADRRMVVSLALAHLLLFQVLGKESTPLLLYTRSAKYHLQDNTNFDRFWTELHEYVSKNHMTIYDPSALYHYMFSLGTASKAIPPDDAYKPAVRLKDAVDARLAADRQQSRLLLGELAALCDALCETG